MKGVVCSRCGKDLAARTETCPETLCPRCQQAARPVVSKTEAAVLFGTACPAESAPSHLESEVNVGSLLPGSSGSLSEREGGTHPAKGVDPSSPPEKASYDFLGPPQELGELGRLGRYRVLKILGAGGMGVVFHAEDLTLRRPVALKAMLPALAAQEVNRQRFLREAQATAALDHDHIVPIFDFGEERGVPFLAMPLLKGESLAVRLLCKPWLPLAEVLRIGREIALGLAAAHAAGLIHRDIKPANVWLEGSSGRVKILDFGLARPAEDPAHLTRTGDILGTPAYMAPEQAAGPRVDARCDLFSLGCVLYQLCTGEMPFKGTSAAGMVVAVATQDPRPVEDLNPQVPRDLAALVKRLLAKRPEDRPGSAQEVAEALQAIALETAPPTDRLPAPGPVPVKRGRPLLRFGLPFLLLAGIGVGAYFLLREEEPGEQKERAPAEVARQTRKPEQVPKPPLLHPVPVPPRKENPKPPKQPPESPPRREPTVDPRGFTNAIGMKLVRIPAGKFLMGFPDSEEDRADDEPRHEVEITRPFYLGVSEVTQEEYQAVMGSNPSYFALTGEYAERVKGLDTRRFPVENVSWEDAQQFCRRLSAREQKKGLQRVYCLPTEAEWEYACRGGSRPSAVSHFGPALSSLQANFDGRHPYGDAAGGPYFKRTAAAGSFKANGFGLYDMHGNVAEWCADWYDRDYYQKSRANDPPGPAQGEARVVRGGSWEGSGWDCRCARRDASRPDYRGSSVGFRIVCSVGGRAP